MKTTIEIVKCDVCGSELSAKNCSLSVVFTTEQTEGRSCTPYLEPVKIDLCQNCLKKVMNGNMIFASGAQGYNSYFFKESKPMTTNDIVEG